MSRESALGHLRLGREDYASCGSVVLHALLPREPEVESVEAIYRYPRNLPALACILTLEYLRADCFPRIFNMKDDELPSRFFKDIYEKTTQTPSCAETFLGGIMVANLYRELNPQLVSGHVIGILGLHRSNRGTKATIADTAGNNDHFMPIRKVSLKRLDQKIAPSGHKYLVPGHPRAIAFTGIPIAELMDMSYYEKIWQPTIDYLEAVFELEREWQLRQ